MDANHRWGVTGFYRLSACLEKHGQFHKLGNIYNKVMVPERGTGSFLRHPYRLNPLRNQGYSTQYNQLQDFFVLPDVLPFPGI